MKRILFVATFIALAHLTFSQRVSLQYDTSSPQTIYAARMLEKSLLERGYSLKETQPDYVISLSINADKLESEAYSIFPVGKKIAINGGDERGLIYGSLSLAEDLRNGIPIKAIKARSEQANLPFRAIKFNLPWDSYRHSEALNQHTETCRDLKFWAAFLDMMAENRLNALTL